SEKTIAVILLFLNKDAVSWFGEGESKFKADRGALLGPVGAITEDQSKSLTGTEILAYAYYEGRLNGDKVDPDFFKEFILKQDNNINMPLYGMKGRDILT